eukprot:4598180-Lingulodinium_polyedra.AAC.1
MSDARPAPPRPVGQARRRRPRRPRNGDLKMLSARETGILYRRCEFFICELYTVTCVSVLKPICRSRP